MRRAIIHATVNKDLFHEHNKLIKSLKNDFLNDTQLRFGNSNAFLNDIFLSVISWPFEF